MTNHNPTFTSSAASGAFSETANTTDSSTLHLLSGTLNFKDADHSDTHTTSATLRSAAWAGGAIPTASLTDLSSAMTSSVLSDSNGTGAVRWSFRAPDSDFDFLARNETLVLTYDVTVADNHGGSAKQTVKVTVTGTEDKPVFDLAVMAGVTEQAGETLSFAPDTAHIALQFTDPDLDNTGHTAQVISAAASGVKSGLLPGFLGTAELMSFFHVDSVAKAAGSSEGTVNTTFSAPDIAFDYLAEGETLDITYTVRLDDHAGGTSTQNVVVTVTGTNDGPAFISGPQSAHFMEDASANLTAHGDLFFADIDLSDTHDVSTTVTAVRSGGGAVPLSDADLLAAMSTTLEDSTGHALGEVDWDFALGNQAVGFLSGGETLTLTYTITVTDPAHATATQTVTVTIVGTNHTPVISSGPESASLTEFADTTGSSSQNTTTPVPTGTIAFTDADQGDTHTLDVSVASTAWSGGAGIPAATQADLATALQTTLNDSTGSGSGGVDWTFSVADGDLDFLAAGETLTVDYNVAVKDATTQASQTVTVTVEGSNDAPLVTSGPGAASVEELPNTNGSSALDATSPVPTGTLSFTDVDLTNTHQIDISVASAVWSTGFEVPPDTQADLVAALATTLHDTAGSGAGSIDWSFSIPDRDLDFLAAGETLTVTYNVTVSDGSASATQTVTITATGAEDGLIVNPVAAAFADTAVQDVGQIVAAGNLIADAGDNGGDLSAILTVTDVNGDAANVGQEIAGAYGTLFVDEGGNYRYTASTALDLLQAGDHSTDQFTFTVTDDHGRSQSTTLSFDVTGADDAPTITAADTTGSITKDTGPSSIVNGGFESGDLTGWTAGPHVQVGDFELGGEFGRFTAQLTPTSESESLFQDIATTPDQHYTVSFFVAGDPEASSSALTVTWGGETLLALRDAIAPGLTQYSFDVVGAADQTATQLGFTYFTDGTGLLLDAVSVNPLSEAAPQAAEGTIHFADVEAGDVHTASFLPQADDYVGTFSLDPITEGAGSGSLGWHFAVDNAAIETLGEGQSLTQVYAVEIADDHGAAVTQNVTITIHGHDLLMI
jgi:VCBS repeat-containing protein